jgi:hypothetical protein
MAKRIIKLICAVGEKINGDQDVGDLLKLVFYPDYNVSGAEILIPGAPCCRRNTPRVNSCPGTRSPPADALVPARVVKMQDRPPHHHENFSLDVHLLLLMMAVLCMQTMPSMLMKQSYDKPVQCTALLD